MPCVALAREEQEREAPAWFDTWLLRLEARDADDVEAGGGVHEDIGRGDAARGHIDIGGEIGCRTHDGQ
jgi:hypothetical protein